MRVGLFEGNPNAAVRYWRRWYCFTTVCRAFDDTAVVCHSQGLSAILANADVPLFKDCSLSPERKCEHGRFNGINSVWTLTRIKALFIGFSFWKTPNTLQGVQNQTFAIFLLLTIFSNFCQQIMPHHITRRALYEARERPSKTYAWQVFIVSDILVEIPWNSLMAVLVFVSWYYPIGLQENAEFAGQVIERGGLMLLYIFLFMNFAGTFTNMMLAAFDTAEAAGNIGNLFFSLSLIFCGYVDLDSQ